MAATQSPRRPILIHQLVRGVLTPIGLKFGLGHTEARQCGYHALGKMGRKYGVETLQGHVDADTLCDDTVLIASDNSEGRAAAMELLRRAAEQPEDVVVATTAIVFSNVSNPRSCAITTYRRLALDEVIRPEKAHQDHIRDVERRFRADRRRNGVAMENSQELYEDIRFSKGNRDYEERMKQLKALQIARARLSGGAGSVIDLIVRGFTPEEVATRLGRSLTSVRSTLARFHRNCRIVRQQL